MKQKRSDLLHLPLNQLKIEEGLNIRKDFGNMEELAASIAENGMKVPVRGYKIRGEDTYVITDGHRRFKAAQMLAERGIEILVPFINDTRGMTDESKVVGMIVFNDGKPLNMLEKADAFNRLVNYGWEEEEIAKKVGKSLTHIKDCLILATASKKLQKAIINKTVSATVVLEQLKTQDSATVEKKIEKVIATKAAKKATTPKKGKAKTKKSTKVSAKDLGASPKKFSTARLRQMLTDVEKRAKEDPTYDDEKVLLFRGMVTLVEGKIDFEEFEKLLWVNEPVD